MNPLHEQLDRGVTRHLCDGQLLIRGRRERRHTPRDFAVDSQRLAARGQDANICALAQKRIRQPGAACNEVFAVVEEKERAPRTEVVDERGLQILRGFTAELCALLDKLLGADKRHDLSGAARWRSHRSAPETS